MIRSILTFGLALATVIAVLPVSLAEAGTCGSDPRSNIGLWRDSLGLFITRSKNTRMMGDPLDATLFQYGASGDTPLIGNWSGVADDTAQYGLYRGSNNLFIFRNADPPTLVALGDPGDVGVVGDWDGDGVDTPGLYRDGIWYLYNTLAVSDPTMPDATIIWGNPGDIPVVGNWTGDGDGQDRIGVYRPGAQPLYFLREDAVGVSCIASTTCNVTIAQWGDQNDLPVVGDWDRDGDTDLGVFRPSLSIFFANQGIAPGSDPFTVLLYGTGTDTPISGDWDGCEIDNG